MDIFYKPPLQRHDECAALEENYMNCMMQKALRDNVLTNRCVMDSILWFHLECPKAAGKFDDPLAFKAKWRDFFAEQRTAMENYTNMGEEQTRIKAEYDKTFYPEDLKPKAAVKAFDEQFEAHAPVYNPPDEEEEYHRESFWDDNDINIKESDYGKRPEWAWPKPITRADSLKHRGS